MIILHGIDFYSCYNIMQHLHNYFEICQMLLDSVGIGKACQAIARCYERYFHAV